MATFYSDQDTKRLNTVPPTRLKVNEYNGRARYSYFSYTTPASSPPQIADIIQLCRVPVGARVMWGTMVTEAFGAGATLAIGISGSTSKYLGATSVAAIGTIDFANTFALNFGQETAVDEDIIATVGGAALAVSKGLRGWVAWTID